MAQNSQLGGSGAVGVKPVEVEYPGLGLLTYPAGTTDDAIYADIDQRLGEQQSNRAHNESELGKIRQRESRSYGDAALEGVGNALGGIKDMAFAANNDVQSAFGGHLLHTAAKGVGMPGADYIPHGNQLVRGAIQTSIDKAQAAAAAGERGDIPQVIGNAAEAALPVIGPWVGNAIERGAADDKGAVEVGAELATGFALPKVAGAVAPRVAAGARAAAGGRAVGRPLTMGQRMAAEGRTGIIPSVVQGVEGVLKNTIVGKAPFKATDVLQREHATGLTQGAQDLVGPRTSPGQIEKLGLDTKSQIAKAKAAVKKPAKKALLAGRDPVVSLPAAESAVRGVERVAKKEVKIAERGGRGGGASANGVRSALQRALNIGKDAEGNPVPVTVGELIEGRKSNRNTVKIVFKGEDATAAQTPLLKVMSAQKRGIKESLSPKQYDLYHKGSKAWAEFVRKFNSKSEIGSIVPSKRSGVPNVQPEAVVDKTANLSIQGMELLEQSVKPSTFAKLKRVMVDRKLVEPNTTTTVNPKKLGQQVVDTRGKGMLEKLEELESQGYQRAFTPDEWKNLKEAARTNAALDPASLNTGGTHTGAITSLGTKGGEATAAYLTGGKSLLVENILARLLADTVGPKRRAKAFVNKFKKTKGKRTNAVIPTRDEEEDN